MNVLLVNNGESPRALPRHVVKKHIPKIADRMKQLALLAPRPLLRSLLSGFGTSEKRFPLGLGYLSAMLRRHGRAQLPSPQGPPMRRTIMHVGAPTSPLCAISRTLEWTGW